MSVTGSQVLKDLGLPLLGELHRSWGWLLGLGIVFILLGFLGLGMTVALTLASVFFFGVFLLLGGVLQAVHAFKYNGWKGIFLHVIIALIYILAGIVTINNPVAASAALTLILALALMWIGVARIVMALQLRPMKNWGWLVFAGVVAVILGLVIAARWPVSGLWVIGLFVAVEMILHGWTYVFVALAAKDMTPAG